MAWRTIEAEGCTWEVRAVASDPTSDQVHEDLLEFRTGEPTRPPRRLAVPTGLLADMDDAALAAAFMKARPLGGDHYGRPGKTMSDAG